MIVSMTDLWLPIVLSTIIAWVASSVIHMVFKYHNADYKPLSNEDEVATAIRNGEPTPGVYSMPYCIDMKEMSSEAMQRKFSDGPVSFVTVFNSGVPAIGKLIGQQLGFFLGGMTLVAYCTSLVVAPGSDYLVVFRFVSTAAFLTYGWAQIPMSIWYGHSWATTARFLLDALIYAFLTAGVFAWLWPGAS